MDKLTRIRNKHAAILLTFVSGIFIGASLAYLMAGTPAVNIVPPVKTFTEADKAIITQLARTIVLDNSYTPETTTFSNTEFKYELPVVIIQEDLHEKLRAGGSYNSDYLIAFLQQGENWAPIYVRIDGEIIQQTQ